MLKEYILEMKNISKSFYKNQVLSDINLNIRPGEIHAIIGENGAGKSTLMNILFGMPVIKNTGGFEGEIYFDGVKVNFNNPIDAMNAGIGMVHQEFMLIPNYTVTENIKLNREITKPNIISKIFGKELEFLDFEKMNKEARESLNKLNIGIDELAIVAGLPVGYKQFIEIAREIDKKNIKLLVFDEPTAVLTESEAKKLLEAMKMISKNGVAILFITHRLDEVIQVSDNITVLRDGKIVGQKKPLETNVVELAELMVGRKIEKLKDKNFSESKNDKIVLSIRNLYVNMPGEEVRGVTLDIYEGEIFGIGGLAGQGKIGIANGIFGLYNSKGEVYVYGNSLELNSPKSALKNNIFFVSEDRRGVGLLLDLSIEMNICIPSIINKNMFIDKFFGISQVNKRKLKEITLKMIKELDIRCTGPSQNVRKLSGGNQQKVCLAKAIVYNPKILLVSEPTRGIDVGAKKIVLDTLVKMNKELGVTIIMTSSELAELKSICDRIAIIDQGKVAGILNPYDEDYKFGLLMGGQRL